MTSDELYQEQPEEKQSSGKLLSPAERVVCEQVSGGTAPFSQRALALLALDAGATQKEAAQQAGQTVGQVRYWLGKFRKERLAIFPQAAADIVPDHVQREQPQDEPAPGETPKDGEKDPPLVDSDKPEQKTKKDPKVKKGKKTNSSKRKKKSKVAGETKKGKGSKKSKKAKKETKSKKGVKKTKSKDPKSDEADEVKNMAKSKKGKKGKKTKKEKKSKKAKKQKKSKKKKKK